MALLNKNSVPLKSTQPPTVRFRSASFLNDVLTRKNIRLVNGKINHRYKSKSYLADYSAVEEGPAEPTPDIVIDPVVNQPPTPQRPGGVKKGSFFGFNEIAKNNKAAMLTVLGTLVVAGAYVGLQN